MLTLNRRYVQRLHEGLPSPDRAATDLKLNCLFVCRDSYKWLLLILKTCRNLTIILKDYQEGQAEALSDGPRATVVEFAVEL